MLLHFTFSIEDMNAMIIKWKSIKPTANSCFHIDWLPLFTQVFKSSIVFNWVQKFWGPFSFFRFQHLWEHVKCNLNKNLCSSLTMMQMNEIIIYVSKYESRYVPIFPQNQHHFKWDPFWLNNGNIWNNSEWNTTTVAW